jgi:hypothetical protein
MQKILDYLNGKKSYLALIAGAIIYSLEYWGYLSKEWCQYLMTLDAFLFAGAIKHAWTKK